MDESSEIQTNQAFPLFFTWFSIAVMLTVVWVTHKNKYIQVSVILTNHYGFNFV